MTKTTKTRTRMAILKDVTGQFRWHLEAANGRITADSGEGYATRASAIRAVRAVVTALRGGVILERDTGAQEPL